MKFKNLNMGFGLCFEESFVEKDFIYSLVKGVVFIYIYVNF